MAVRLATRFWRAPWSGATAVRVLSAYRQAQEVLRSQGPVDDIARAQVDLAAARTGVPASHVSALVEEWIDVRPLDVIASSARSGLVAALDALRDRGLRLGVVSDYPATAKLAALGVADRFDTVVSAGDRRVQAFKPDPRGLTVALKDLGLHSSETLYVGDRADVDAPAAAAAGMSCVLIGSPRRRSDNDGETWVPGLAQLLEVVEGR